MELVLQIALAGLAQGCLYALIALGLVVISNTSGVLNFAQGAMGMAVTYVAWFLLTSAGVNFWLAVAIAAAVAFALGVLAQVVLLKDALGYSFEEIAEAAGMPVGTAKCHAHRGRARMRSKLEDVA